MYKEDDFMTRRDRINESLLKQLLGEDQENVSVRRNVTMPRTQQRVSCNDKNCLGKSDWGLTGVYPLASAFAPLQSFRKLYDAEDGWHKGTIFEELYFPFMGSPDNGGCDNNGCNNNGCNRCGGR